MLHAIVCEVNYATNSGEIVVKNCCVTQIRQREKLVLLNQLIKIRNCLTKPKEYGILTKKSNEQRFDFVALKTARGRVFKSRFQLLKIRPRNRADFLQLIRLSARKGGRAAAVGSSPTTSLCAIACDSAKHP